MSSLSKRQQDQLNEKLYRACDDGNVSRVSELIAEGANINCRDPHTSWTPLLVSSWYGHSEVVRLLLSEPEIDINAGELITDMTALHYSAARGHTAVAKQLIGAGADTDTTDNDGETPLDWARQENHQDIVDLMERVASTQPSSESDTPPTSPGVASTQLRTATATTQLPTATGDHSRALSPPSLTVKHLVRACKRVTDWHTLGLQLDLTMDQLDDIHITYKGYKADRHKAEMFNVWLKSSPSASWSDLITALRAMDEDSVASDIAATQSSVREPVPSPVQEPASN